MGCTSIKSKKPKKSSNKTNFKVKVSKRKKKENIDNTKNELIQEKTKIKKDSKVNKEHRTENSCQPKPVAQKKEGSKSKNKKKPRKGEKSKKRKTVNENMGDAPPMEILEEPFENELEVELQIKNNQIVSVREENGIFLIEYVRNKNPNKLFLPAGSDFKFCIEKKGKVSLVEEERVLDEISIEEGRFTKLAVNKDVLVYSNENGDLLSLREKNNKLKLKEEMNIKSKLFLFEQIEEELVVLNQNQEVFMVNENRMRLIARDVGEILDMSVQTGSVWLIDKNGTVSAYDLQTCKQIASFCSPKKILSGLFVEERVLFVEEHVITVATLKGEIVKEVQNLSNSAIYKIFENSSFAVLASKEMKRLEVWDKDNMEIPKFEELTDQLYFIQNIN